MTLACLLQGTAVDPGFARYVPSFQKTCFPIRTAMQGASSRPAVHSMCSFWHDPFFSNFGRLGLEIMHSGFVHFECMIPFQAAKDRKKWVMPRTCTFSCLQARNLLLHSSSSWKLRHATSGFVRFKLRAAVSNRNCYARSKFRACSARYVQFLA